MITLYGTPEWDAMTRDQQRELSRQQLVNMLSAGIWFENILNQALLREMMHTNPTARSTQYMLTELGDETRHMVMFGKTIDRVGGIPVRPRLYQRVIINCLPFIFRGPVLWEAALIGEELFDALQRQILDDPELQPIVRRLMRIHVTEEARHIQFARDGLRKAAPTMPWYLKILAANLHGAGGPFYRLLFTHPVYFHRAGLDGARMSRSARANPHFQRKCRESFAPLAAFLEEVGLMGRLGRRMWRRAGFL
ncbi:MAG: AurF N-oxygenase family protein, partial [Mycobacterium sp.]